MLNKIYSKVDFLTSSRQRPTTDELERGVHTAAAEIVAVAVEILASTAAATIASAFALGQSSNCCCQCYQFFYDRQ